MMFTHSAVEYVHWSPILTLCIPYASWANEFLRNFLVEWALYVLADILGFKAGPANKFLLNFLPPFFRTQREELGAGGEFMLVIIQGTRELESRNIPRFGLGRVRSGVSCRSMSTGWLLILWSTLPTELRAVCSLCRFGFHGANLRLVSQAPFHSIALNGAEILETSKC